MKKEAIIIDGFLVTTTLPSPSLLEIRFKEMFKNTVMGSKAVHTVKGWFLNKLKRLSAKYYTDILKNNAIKLSSIGGGLYLLPISKVSVFKREVEKLKEEYKTYESQLKDFLERGIIPSNINTNAEFDSEYLVLLKDYLESQGVTETIFEAPKISERVKVNLIPLRISPELFEKYVEESAKDYKQEKLNEVAEDVRLTREAMIQDMEKDIEKKISELQKMLQEALKKKVTKKRIKSLRSTFANIEYSASEIGLAEKHSARFEAMKEVISALASDNLEKGIKVDNSAVATGRTKALLELATPKE